MPTLAAASTAAPATSNESNNWRPTNWPADPVPDPPRSAPGHRIRGRRAPGHRRPAGGHIGPTGMMPASRAAVVLLVLATSGCTSGASPAPSMQHGPEPAPIATTLTSTTSGVGARSPLHDLPLPEPVEYRDDPRTAAVADPSFVALPGATAHFGRLGSAVYQIEIPDRWNGRLVMWAHGCEEFAPQASVAGPDLRPYLISHGYAW